MKLASPRTVQTNLNEQRRMDVDSGLQLARKVDNVRETLANEEKKLESFKNFTIKAVQEEIDTKITERNSLEKALVPLRDERKELLKPLNAEWNEINQKKVTLEQEKETILSLKQEAIQLVSKAEEKLKLIVREEERIKAKSVVTQQELETANKASLEAQKCLKEAKLEEKCIKLLLDKRERLVKEQEDVLTSTLRSIEIREKQLVVDLQFIADEKIRLVDMRETLERALARVNK